MGKAENNKGSKKKTTHSALEKEQKNERACQISLKLPLLSIAPKTSEILRSVPVLRLLFLFYYTLIEVSAPARRHPNLRLGTCAAVLDRFCGISGYALSPFIFLAARLGDLLCQSVYGHWSLDEGDCCHEFLQASPSGVRVSSNYRLPPNSRGAEVAILCMFDIAMEPPASAPPLVVISRASFPLLFFYFSIFLLFCANAANERSINKCNPAKTARTSWETP